MILTNKLTISGILLFAALLSTEANAQTRLTNPKAHIVSNDTRSVAETPLATPYVTHISHKRGPVKWVILTPTEFSALSKEEQENAASKPDIFFVTEEHKELFTMKLGKDEKVVNLIAQQPIKQ